jgi:hypothetical protein
LARRRAAGVGGFVAGLFFSKDATSFTVVQMMFATLMLAAFVALLVFWQGVAEYCRSLWKTTLNAASLIVHGNSVGTDTEHSFAVFFGTRDQKRGAGWYCSMSIGVGRLH